MIRYCVSTSIVFVLLVGHITIPPIAVQAQAEASLPVEEVVVYQLNEATLKRGYPAQSSDGRFTLLIGPRVLQGDVVQAEIAPAPKEGAAFAYRFRVVQDGVVPLVKKPFIVVFSVENSQPYARLYYYYPPRSVWLALAAVRDKERGTLVSNRVDFAEAVIGVFLGSVPLPDTVYREASSETKSESGNVAVVSLPPQSEPFTAVLQGGTLKDTHTIPFSEGAALTVPSGAVSAPSVITVFFDEEKRVLDFAIKPFDPLVSPLSPRAFLELTFTASSGAYEEQAIAFWDNNTQSYRELQTMYREDGKVSATTPFHFGKYTVVPRKGVHRGEASWFRDSLLHTPFGAASNDYPKGTRLRVTNLKNGASVEVEVRSTGPFVAGRIIDLTKTAFSKIANPRIGIITARVERTQ